MANKRPDRAYSFLAPVPTVQPFAARSAVGALGWGF